MYRVLLVDDEAMAREGLRETFRWEENGFELVGEASNGAKAMPWIEKKEIDILITDIKMPVMDGLELTRITRERSPWVQVLLLSCYSDFEYVREGLRLGAADYLLKPTMEPEDLAGALNKMKLYVDKEKNHLAWQRLLQERSLPARSAETGGRCRSCCPSAEVCDLDSSALPWDGKYHARIVRQAIQYINARYTEMITLQEVANHVSISKNYFSELFKKVTGLNFIEYLIHLRMQRAKELLATTTLKIYEIAEQCGFNDVKHFSKLFKKLVRLSPAEYRERWSPLPDSPLWKTGWRNAPASSGLPESEAWLSDKLTTKRAAALHDVNR